MTFLKSLLKSFGVNGEIWKELLLFWSKPGGRTLLRDNLLMISSQRAGQMKAIFSSSLRDAHDRNAQRVKTLNPVALRDGLALS